MPRKESTEGEHHGAEHPVKEPCPECGADLNGLRPYKHGVSCMGYEDKGVEDVRARYALAAEKGNEHAKRIMKLLEIDEEAGF